MASGADIHTHIHTHTRILTSRTKAISRNRARAWFNNNHSGAYIADTRNSTGAYIVIMASLQALVSSLLVWQSSCENKLRPSKQLPDACWCSAYNQNIDKQLVCK